MIHQILLFFFITATIHLKNTHQISTCANNHIHIHPPFKLQTDHPQKDDPNFINLRCGDQGQVVINLPASGDFYVASIDYVLRKIALEDPGDCLLGRLMMSSASPYPLEAYSLRNYTYYVCPKERLGSLFTEIRCLSNPMNATIATSDVKSDIMEEMYGCIPVASSMIPDTRRHKYKLSVDFSQLQLTWKASGCRGCDDQSYSSTYYGDSHSSSSKLEKFLQSSAFIGAAAVLVTFSGLACLLRISRVIGGGDTVEDVARIDSIPAPAQASTGEKSRVKKYSEVVFGGEGEGTIVCCSICLEEYNDKDIVKSLDECGHYFHLQCIDLWLQKNNSCPVCRTQTS